jgi:hypothetical protein
MRSVCIVPGCPEILEDDQPCPLHPEAAQIVSHRAGAEMVLGTMTRDEARRRLYDTLIGLGGCSPKPDERIGERLERIVDDETYRWVDALLWAAIAPPEPYSQQTELGGPAHCHLACLVNTPCDACPVLESVALVLPLRPFALDAPVSRTTATVGPSDLTRS